MGKIEKLLDKTKRNGETKKWKMYVFAVVGILIIVGGFFGGMALLIPVIDDYLQDNKQIINLYDFYSKEHSNSTNVYLIGSSQMGRAVYTPLVNQKLQERGYNISVFSLSVDLDLPIQRLTELQEIINCNPALIIWGVSYRDFYNETNYSSSDYLPEERFKLTSGRVHITDGSKRFYSPDFQKIIETNLDILDYKSFVKNACLYLLKGHKSIINYSEDNYDYNFRIDNTKSTTINNLKNQVSGNIGYWKNEVDVNSENRHVVDYMIGEFNKRGIPVILLSMPLHPFLSDTFTTKSKDNYFQILNETGVSYYDYEALFTDASDFSDLYHMSFSGAQKFSPLLADLIIQELS